MNHLESHPRHQYRFVFLMNQLAQKSADHPNQIIPWICPPGYCQHLVLYSAHQVTNPVGRIFLKRLQSPVK